MKKTPPLAMALDAQASQPLYRQIYLRYRDAIAQAILRPGDRVASVRTLAAELGLARGTVETAYDLLTAEGYFVSRGQAGTVVAPALSEHPAVALQAAPQAGRGHARPTRGTPAPLPFQMGLPALDAFPRKLWARLGNRHLRGTLPADMAYTDNAGYAPLRVAIARYLHVSRGIACGPEQVFVTAGYGRALELICRALMQPDDAVWMEDPGFPPAWTLIESAGGKPVPVPVDEQGLNVAAGIALSPSARFAVTTPTNQSPLGVSLSLSRRLELLDWADAAQAWIIEDDYDGEFRYTGRPLPALKSLDRQGRVLYAGTFSKVLAPSLRLAYLVVPAEQVPLFQQTCAALQYGCPYLTQAVLADFMEQGHFSRHIKKMRTLYAQRRTMAAQGLLQALGPGITVEMQAGGLHLLLRMNGKLPDHELALRMRQNGLSAQALSDWTRTHGQGQALLLSFTNIDTPETAEKLGRRILALYE